VGGIDIVVFAVVERGAKIDDGESSEIAASCGVSNAALDGWDPVAWNGAAENVVDELDALTTFDRLHLDAADSELAVAAGLLFVFTFGVCFAANRFAIRDFGRLEREVDVVTLVQFGHDNFDVLLSRASE